MTQNHVLTQFQYDLLDQIASGPAVGVFVLKTLHNEQLISPLLSLNLLEDISDRVFGSQTNYRAVVLTENGIRMWAGAKSLAVN